MIHTPKTYLGIIALISCLSLSSPHAQERGVDIDAIRNEIQAARASSQGAGTPSIGVQAKARIKSNEDALLDEIQNDEMEPLVPQVVPPIVPQEAPAQSASIEVEMESPVEEAAPRAQAVVPVQKVAQHDDAARLHGAELELSYIKLKNSYKALQGKLKDTERERDTALGTISTLQNELARSRKETAEGRRRLLLAETEIERLAHEAQVKSEKRMKETLNLNSARSTVAQETADPDSEPAREIVAPEKKTYSASTTATKQNDVAIATVIVDKIYLRSGPGKDNSPVMTVAKGVRLTVETQKGDWLRVITPNGGRAWVSSEVVQLN